MRDQKFDDVEMTIEARSHQSCVAGTVATVHIGAGVEQKLSGLITAIATGEHQRRMTFRILNVDIFWRDDLSQPFDVPASSKSHNFHFGLNGTHLLTPSHIRPFQASSWKLASALDSPPYL